MTTKRYTAEVPVILTLQVESSMDPEQTIAALMSQFEGDTDPLLGTNLKYWPGGRHYHGSDFMMARTRGAKLNGRVAMKDE